MPSILGERKMSKKDLPLVDVRRLKKYYPIKLGFFKSLLSKNLPFVRAVDDINIQIYREEVFGLVGESGCGKTTTGRCIIKLIEPTSGKIIFEGKDITSFSPTEMKPLRSKLQIIFQDPYESLNPRMSIYDIISEPVSLQKVITNPDEIRKRSMEVLEAMGLTPPEEFLYRFPHELSGGQRQRVAIARAFIVAPEFIVADEPVSMLDASIRSEIAKLMLSLIEKFHCSYLYITHDVALARYMCDRIAVMYLGKIAEQGNTEDLIQHPIHPYTEALLAAVPVPDPTARRIEVVIKGEVPSLVNPPSGCRFHTRCPYGKDRCRKEEPQLVEYENGRLAACHYPLR